MSKLASLKANGSLNISIESKLFETIRRANTWYTSKKFSGPMFLVLVVIDVIGFMQIAKATMNTNLLNRILIVAAFSVAFEIAPLYIGYSTCLKSYNLGKPIHKIVFWLSLVSFGLGIIGNGIYRGLTMNIAYMEPDLDGINRIQDEVALPMTILMFILPIITSLVNIVIGCLSFDPLLFDLLRLSKKLRILRVRKRQLEAFIKETADDEELEKDAIDNDEQCYNKEKTKLLTTSMRLKNYISVRSASAYKCD